MSELPIAGWPEMPFRTVELNALTHFFGSSALFVDASARLSSGDIVAFVGPNGAGKTTLMRILGTLLRPSEGSVVVDDEINAFDKRRYIRPHIGWMGHDVMLYPQMTGRENVEYWASLHGAGQDDVSAWLDACGLGAAGERRVATYSRGMKQRLTIARSLVHRPALILWDEPSTGLDAEGRAFLAATLDALRLAGRIVVVVTHRLTSLNYRFDAVWAMRNATLSVHPGTDDLTAVYRQGVQGGAQ